MSDGAAAQRVVLAGGRVFDGEKFLDGPHDVVFAGGTVEGVRPAGGEPAAGASVIDVRGKTVAPGFIDSHVHIMAAGAGDQSFVFDPYTFPMYRAITHLKQELSIGITTVRDAGGSDAGLKKAVAEGIVAGPRLKISVAMMSQTGGHGDDMEMSGILLGRPAHPGVPASIADGVEEARKVVRTLLRAGADQIKICSTGGVLSATDDPRHSQFTRAEIAVIVEEAAARGTYVMAHAQGSTGIKNALREGVHSIEHGIYLDDEAIELLLEKDAYLVPTLVAPHAVVKSAENGGVIPPHVLAKARRVIAEHRASVERAIAAGVKIAMGTDTGVGLHGTNLEELDLLWQCGMGLEQVLAAATSVAGELVAPNEKIGRLAPGYLADAVVLDMALTDGSQLAKVPSSVASVYQAGVCVV